MSRVRRIDQGMAAAAARLLPEKIDQKLRTRYRTLNVMVRDAGLAATYAYIAAKSNGTDARAVAYGMVSRGIRDHLGQRGLKPAEVTSDREMLDHLGSMDLHTYTRASAEVAALMLWLSRLADALYREDGQ